MTIESVNPATGEVLKTFDALTPEEIETRLAAAAAAFDAHRRTSFAQRAEWMRAAADLLDADQDYIAHTMTSEMGKTLKSAKAGLKLSGYGRELSALGIREFCNAKTIWVG